MFVCPESRAAFADSHASLTGHTRFLVDDLPLDEGIPKTYTAWPNPKSRTNELEVPSRHVLAFTQRDRAGQDLIAGGQMRVLLDCSCGQTVVIDSPAGRFAETARTRLAAAHA